MKRTNEENAAPAAVAWTGPTSLETFASGRFALPAVLATALALRIAHLVALADSPFAQALQLDARFYDAWGVAISNGAWVGDQAFWVDPLFAYVLGFLYTLFGHDLWWARIFNVACGVATAWVAARLAARVWESRAAGLFAALLFGLLVPAVFFEGQVEKTALATALVAIAVERLAAVTDASSAERAGAWAGAAVLARGNALLLVVLGIVWLARVTDRPRVLAIRYAVAALLVTGLATLHNALAAGEFVPTTTNLGVNLYLGNHDGNEHGYYSAPPFVRSETSDEQPGFHAEATRRTSRTLSDGELSGFWTREAIGAVLRSPLRAVGRTIDKARLVLNDTEVPDNEDPRIVAKWSPVLRAPGVSMGLLWLAGGLGIALGRRRRGVQLVAAAALAYAASLLPFFVLARLRLPLAPLLAVLGGGALAWAIDRARAGAFETLLRASTVPAALLLVVFLRPEWMARQDASSLAIAWNNLGAAFLQDRRSAEAIDAYERAVAHDAASVPSSMAALVELYRAGGEPAKADAMREKLVAVRPDSVAARQVQRDGGRAPEDGRARVREAITTARAQGKQGDWARAIATLQEAVRTLPYDEDLHYVLGDLMEQHATPDEQLAFFAEEQQRDRKPQTSAYFQALALARKSDAAGAIAKLEEALRIDPAHEMSQLKWGLVLEQEGRDREALEHLLEATRIHPDFPGAFEAAARVAARLGQDDEATRLRAAGAKADPNSPARFLHWARYLHAKGRDRAALEEIGRLLALRPGDAEALALRAEITGATGTPGFPAPMLEQLVTRLQETPYTAWISFDGRHAEAAEDAAAIARALETAGWQVKRLGAAPIALRPGIFLFAADEASPGAEAVHEAFDAVGIAHSYGSAYRAFAEEKRREDPSWRGISFAEDQAFSLVVGRRAAAN